MFAIVLYLRRCCNGGMSFFALSIDRCFCASRAIGLYTVFLSLRKNRYYIATVYIISGKNIERISMIFAGDNRHHVLYKIDQGILLLFLQPFTYNQ